MIIPEILKNPLVIGSLGLSAGSIIGYFRGIPQMLGSTFEQFFTCSIQVSNMDDEDTFQLVRTWVSGLDYAKRTRNLTGIMKGDRWVLTPAPGNHFFWFEGHPVWLHRNRNQPSSDLRSQILKFQETITLRIMTRNKAIIGRLCDEIREFSKTVEIPNGHMRINTTYYSDWESHGAKVSRSLESVILPQGDVERIQADLEGFWRSKERYQSMGIPYRRGWLFQGVPGSGKTSLVSALAGHYRRDVYLFSLSHPDLTDERLIMLFRKVKNGNIVLFEDIDAAFNKRKGNDAKGITLSGLLNALDGVASPEGTAVIMTTNHPEKLDHALIRPGRIDQVMDFGAATDDQLERLYKRFTNDQNPEEFVRLFQGKTIAEAQVYLLGKGYIA